MDSSIFWPVFAQVVLACLLAAAIFIVSHLLGQRGRPGKIKDTPYECGVAAKAEPIGPFSVKFYNVALLFILFDVELAILLPWVFSFQSASESQSFAYLLGGLTFIGLMTLGLIYELKKGGLNWEK